MTLQWTSRRLKSTASRLFIQPFVRRKPNKNIKAPRHWPMWGKFTGDRWISRTRPETWKMFPFDDVIMQLMGQVIYHHLSTCVIIGKYSVVYCPPCHFKKVLQSVAFVVFLWCHRFIITTSLLYVCKSSFDQQLFCSFCKVCVCVCVGGGGGGGGGISCFRLDIFY